MFRVLAKFSRSAQSRVVLMLLEVEIRNAREEPVGGLIVMGSENNGEETNGALVKKLLPVLVVVLPQSGGISGFGERKMMKATRPRCSTVFLLSSNVSRGPVQ